MKKVILTWLLLGAGAFAISRTLGQGKPPSEPPLRSALPKIEMAVRDTTDLKVFLDRLDVQVEALRTAGQLEHYYQLKGWPAPNLQAYQELLASLFQNRDYAQVVKTWQAKAQDPQLRRRLELYADGFRLALVDPGLVQEFFALQSKLTQASRTLKLRVGGRDITNTERLKILQKESDRQQRQEAFLASAAVAERVAPDVLKLMKTYNAIYRQAGFNDAVEGVLAGSELSRAEVLDVVSRLMKLTRPLYQQLIERVKHDLKVEEVQPWDVFYWTEQQADYPVPAFPHEKAKPRLFAFMQGLGFKTDRLPIHIEETNLSFLGLAIPVHIPNETRILTNRVDGIHFYATLFHEYGHALHQTLIDQNLGTFRGIGPGAFAEGLAHVMESFIYDREWLRQTTGLSDEDIGKYQGIERLRRAHRIRETLAGVVFEYELFAQPEQDPHALYNKTRAEYLFLPPAEKTLWADNPLYITHQVYQQNYLIAHMVAAQVRRALTQRFNGRVIGNTRVAGFLREHFYKHGRAKPWKEMVLQATGKPLSVDALAEELAGK